MEIKTGANELRIIPATGGVIVSEAPNPQNDGMLMQSHTWVFTDHEELGKFLFRYYVNVDAELKARAENA